MLAERDVLFVWIPVVVVGQITNNTPEDLWGMSIQAAKRRPGEKPTS
jgi:hypothetical protein